MNVRKDHGFLDIDPHHCTLCGTCVGICPHDALDIKNEKVFLKSDCRHCGLCFEICPGRSVDFSGLNKRLFDSEDCDGRIGFYRVIAQAHSLDNDIRKNASSGGVVTALLLYLLDNGIIDGAVIVGASTTDPVRPEVKVARTREEILRASQSRYCLVPVNTILRTLRHEEGKFALVGLPCHIHGIRNLQHFNRPESGKILITIGLFCGFNMHFEGTEFLLKKLGVERNDIIELKYRGNGHPGGFVVKTKTTKYFLDKHIYNIINPVFIPRRCLVCPDLTNELADISVGDIWKKTDGKGWSSVIIRSSLGQRLFEEAIRRGYLKSEELPYGDLISSHNHLIKYKKEQVCTRMELLKADIDFGSVTFQQGRSTRMEAFLFGYLYVLLHSSLFKALLRYVPLRVIDWMGMIVNRRIRHT